MFHCLRLIMLLLFGSTLVHAQSPSISGYMACARAMGVAINERFAVVPSERSGSKGLFVYTDRSAFFLPLGVPRTDNAEEKEFFLKTHIANVGEIFFTFRENKTASKSKVPSTIGYRMTPPPQKELDNYRTTVANDSSGDPAREAISNRLREKIVTVKEFIDEKNAYSTPSEAKVAFEKDRKIYLAKLETCRLDADRALSYVVAEEMQKLETGFPGITVWEKQVGGRTQSAQTSR
ncbi:MAG: hypothetical protein ACKVQK_13050 [Burkholderiales bacterium]